MIMLVEMTLARCKDLGKLPLLFSPNFIVANFMR